VERVKIAVELRRRRGEGSTRVRLLDTFLGSGEKAFRRLDARIATITAHEPDLSGFLDAAGEVPHKDVIRCIDSFRKAGVEDLEFRGAPPPGRDS
jgi:biopolymer transport protein ExbD